MCVSFRNSTSCHPDVSRSELGRQRIVWNEKLQSFSIRLQNCFVRPVFLISRFELHKVSEATIELNLCRVYKLRSTNRRSSNVKGDLLISEKGGDYLPLEIGIILL